MTTGLSAIQGYNSNSKPGYASVGADWGVYDVDANQKCALGTEISREDGTKYRYCSFVGAVAQGLLVSHIVADVDNVAANIATTPASTYQQGGEQVGIYPGAAGSRYILITLASVIKDQFAGGYMSVTDSTGYGYIYRVKGNNATGTTVSGKVLVELYEMLQVATASTTYVAFVGSLYTDMKACSYATDCLPVGVTMANMTAGTYGWVITKGPACVLTDGTVTLGAVVQPSIVTAGAVMEAGVGTTTTAALTGNPFVGYVLSVGATTKYSTVMIQLG
jgi:hypothetical protein